MTTLELLANIVDTLAWPAALVAVAIIVARSRRRADG